MANFTIDGRMKNLPDIQRSYLWELYIPSIEELDQDEMVLRVRNVIIPGRNITAIESYFMGARQFFTGRTEYNGTFTTQMEEFEDQKVHKAINSWQQLIFNYDPENSKAGQQGLASKSDITRNMTLRMYKANGEKMPNDIKFYNAWPQSIGDATLDYTASESVKFDVVWQFDYWLSK